MKPQRTWILVADGSRAHVFENHGRGSGVHAVEGRSYTHASDASHELGRDRPTRSHESVGHARHAAEPKADLHDKQKLDFARILAGEITAAHSAGLFDSLVLVAPHPFLGALRDELPKPVAVIIKAEIAKDLTKTPVAELASHLDDAISV